MGAKKKPVQRTKALYIAMILVVLALLAIMVAAVTYQTATLSIPYVSPLSGGTEILANVNKCYELTALVSATNQITPGDYSFPSCTQLPAPNSWFCDCTNNYSLSIFTKPAINNTYTISVNYTYAVATNPGNPLVCPGPWSDCADGVWYRLCYAGNTPVMIYDPCTGNNTGNVTPACTENWQCGSWNSCQLGNYQTRLCSDLNTCGTTLAKPGETQTCLYNGGSQNCTENWQCSNWNTCQLRNTQTRTCTDSNNCGTTLVKPGETQSCLYGGGNNQTCTESWQCTLWENCQPGNIQTRTCLDNNNCGTVLIKPGTSQSCLYGGGNNQTCTESWQCTDWGSCSSDSTQLRTCTDSNNCGTAINIPAAIQSCTYNAGGGSGGGSSGGGSGGSSGDGDTRSWTCEPYGPCINGKSASFCYHDTRGLNYTVSKACVENKTIISPPKEIINLTKPINEPGNQTGGQTNHTVNETGGNQITGNIVKDDSSLENWWPLLLLILLLIFLILYQKRKEISALFAGKKKTRRKPKRK